MRTCVCKFVPSSGPVKGNALHSATEPEKTAAAVSRDQSSSN